MHEEDAAANALQKVNYLVLLKGLFVMFSLQNLLLETGLDVFEDAVEEEGHSADFVLDGVLDVDEFDDVVGVFFGGEGLAP